ncbi:hypothetical protein [Clostridium thermarum]|nr:hypothetical protein [Clostridium thermarum]
MTVWTGTAQKTISLHILKVAAVGTPLFTDEAISEVFQYTGGIPRFSIC